MNLNSVLKSKRFWLTAAAVAVIVFKDKTGLSELQISEIVWAVGGWVIGESIRPVDPVKS